jgi:hypothetical protein
MTGQPAGEGPVPITVADQRGPRSNGILGARFATGLFRQANLDISDDEYLNEWTAVLAVRIETHQ